MGSIGPPSDLHLVFTAFPGYGHVRPLRSLAKSLTARGYSITFITSDYFRPTLEAIENVDFEPFLGLADFNPDNMFDKFPDRSNQPEDATRAVWDVEHVFFGCLDDTFIAIQKVLARPELASKKVVLVTDGFMTGALPVSLDSPQVRRVPVIALANFPFLSLSKNTAPFGSGLPDLGEEKNIEMNAMVTQMFSGAQATCERILAKYNCKRALPSKFPLDLMFFTPEVYLQLTVPELERPRTDLPNTVQFVGTLLGANDNRGIPDWYHSFVVDGNEKPLVVVTSGTLPSVNTHDLIIPTIEACRTLPVRLVVCAVTATIPVDLAIPSNVKVASWLPFEDLFQHASIVVTNGGFGGINQAFAAGLPMVVAGLTEDKMETTARAEMTGAAVNLKTQRASTEQVKDALERVLRDKTFKEKALELKKAFAQRDTVGLIETTILAQVEKFFG